MKRLCLAALLTVGLALSNASAEHDPIFPSSLLEIYTHGRLFSYWDDLSAMIEYTGRFEDSNLEYRYQSLLLGGYYRLHENVKAGAFYKLQLGARHDDDWIDTNPGWDWVDSRGRFEHLALVDVTPRFRLEFIPDGNWVFAVKNRYAFNFFNSHQTLLVRPGLTWFWIVDREPVVNVSAQYATYFSLNFGDRLWYEHGPYLNVLYHATHWLAFDASTGYRTTYWTESADFVAGHPNQGYTDNDSTTWFVDLGAVITLRN